MLLVCTDYLTWPALCRKLRHCSGTPAGILKTQTAMAHIRNVRSRSTVLALFVLIGISLAITPNADAEDIRPAPATNRTEGGAAVVYVIDKSTSMLWIYEDLKETLKEAIAKSEPGDSLTVILFGDSVTTLASYKTMNESKKQTVSNLLDSISPDSFYTNLTLAVGRGTESLYGYFNDDIAENYTLVLVTDGKNHPSPKLAPDYSIEEALTQFPDFLPGQQWSLRYVALESQIDPELFSMVQKYGESFFDVEKIAEMSDTTQAEVVGGILTDSLVWQAYGAAVTDQSGIVSVKRVYEETWTPLRKGLKEKLYSGDAISVETGSRAALSLGPIGTVGLMENTEIRLENLQNQPVKKSFTIKLKLEGGTIWNSVDAPNGGSLDYEILTPIAVTAVRGTVLRVELDKEAGRQSVAVVEGTVEMSSLKEEPVFDTLTLQGGTYMEIVAGEQPSPPKPIPSEILIEWARWMKALVWRNPFSRINFNTVRVTPGVVMVTMGPVAPGGEFNRYIPIKFSEEYYGKKTVSAEVVIDLPPGIEASVKIIDIEDDKLMKNILLSIECSPYLRYSGSSAYQGQIRLMAPGSDLRFTRAYIDLEILHPPPRLYALRKHITPRIRALIATVGSALLFFGLLLVWIKRDELLELKRKATNYLRDKMVKTRLIHVLRARPIGLLVPCEAPAGVGRRPYDLPKLSRAKDTVILGIGTDPSNSIILSHPSIQPLHCTIWAGRKRNPTRVYIEPCSDGHLAVNGERTKEYRQLQDKDIVEIGQCRFKFVDRQTEHQVRVCMNDKTVYDGRLEFWDLSQSVFYMTHISGEQEKFLALSFSDVRYVQFYRDESERKVDILVRGDQKSKKWKAVTVTLTNGKKLHGFVDKKYRHKKSADISLHSLSEGSDIQYTYIPGNSIEALIIEDSPQGA